MSFFAVRSISMEEDRHYNGQLHTRNGSIQVMQMPVEEDSGGKIVACIPVAADRYLK